MLRVNLRCYPVSQIENMATAGTEGLQDTANLGADSRGTGVENSGIHITLQCNMAADPPYPYT